MVKLHKTVMRGSLILLITFNIFNLLNFIFQFSMARMLSVSEYGILATLFSIIYILGIFSESIQTVITKYIATEKENGKIKNLLKRALRKSIYLAILLFIAYTVLAIPFAFILEIDYALLALNGLMIFSAFVLPITRGAMQGKKMFTGLGINLVIESVTKLVLAILFVYILSIWMPESKIYGAMLAIILGALLAVVWSLSTLEPVFKSKEINLKTPHIYAHATPIFIVTLAIIAFYSLDVIIAKIVFSAEIAGFYALASILAKAVFWGTQPISKAMFPLSAEEAHKKKITSTVKHAGILLAICLIAVLAVMYLFPEFIIKVFTGRAIAESAQILFYVAFSMGIIATANLVLLGKVSKGITKGYWWLLLILPIETILLVTNASNLVSFSFALMASAIIFLLASLLILRR